MQRSRRRDTLLPCVAAWFAETLVVVDGAMLVVVHGYLTGGGGYQDGKTGSKTGTGTVDCSAMAELGRETQNSILRFLLRYSAAA